MRATLGDLLLAESDDTHVVEGNHYFPPESVNWDLLERGRGKSLCIWKGMASYLDADAGERDGKARSVAWTYRRPYPWIRKIRGHVAFWGPVEVSE